MGVTALLAGALLRATVQYEPLPGFGTDPLLSPTPVVGLTPGISGWIDLAMVAAAGLVVVAGIAKGWCRGRVAAMVVATWGVGASAAIWHGWLAPGARAEDAMLAGAWASGLAAGVGAWMAARDRGMARVVLAGLVVLVGVLLLRSLVQVYVEHPRTMATFRANRGVILAAQGWAEGSAMARAYERRLSQPEATGWFGLANVVGTVGVGLMGVMVAWFFGSAMARGSLRRAVGEDRRVGDGMLTLACVGGFMAGGILLLAGGKGAAAATALAVALAGLGAFIAWRAMDQRASDDVVRRRVRVWSAGGAAALAGVCVLGPIVAVVARGMLGESLGERSVLFRWFYLEASARVILDRPWGVGPTGFKEEYARLKNPLSPEEVSSPHSTIVDWVATLGVAGWAWAGLLVAAAIGAGRTLLRSAIGPPNDPATEPTDDAGVAVRVPVRAVLVAGAAAMGAGATLESAIATPEGAMVRLGGLALGLIVAVGVLRAPPLILGVGVAAGGLGVVAHGQIELSAVTPGAIAWLAMLVGTAAGWHRASARLGGESAGPTGIRRASLVIGAAALAGVVGLGAWGQTRSSAGGWVGAWASAMTRAGETLARAGRVSQRWEAINRGNPEPGDSPEALAIDLNRELAALGVTAPGEPRVGTGRRELEGAVGRVRLAAIDRAKPELELALRLSPAEEPSAVALTRLMLQRADAAVSDRSGGGAEAAKEAADWMEGFADRWPTVGSLGWLVTLRREEARRAEAAGDGAWARRAREGALGVLRRATQRVPGDLVAWQTRAMVAAEVGALMEAREAAGRALEIDGLMRLDPLRRLGEGPRREMERLAE